MSVPDYSMEIAPALVTHSKRYLFSVDRILCAGKTLSFILYNICKSDCAAHVCKREMVGYCNHIVMIAIER